MKSRINVRALVIDDDDATCRRISDWLEAESFDVAAFTDPSLGVLHASRHGCDVALVDLRMPNVSGPDVIAMVCRNSPQARVLAMTAFPENDQILKAREAGARDLIEKPIQAPQLFEALARQLSELGISSRTEVDFNRKLGARLREIRQGADKTQSDIAHAAGITPAQLSQIELGKTATSTWTLARICNALRINLSSLFQGL